MITISQIKSTINIEATSDEFRESNKIGDFGMLGGDYYDFNQTTP